MLSELVEEILEMDKRFASAWCRKRAGLILGIVAVGFTSTGFPEAMPLTAPLNPDFVQHQIIGNTNSITGFIGQSIAGNAVGGRAKGLIPSPVDRSHMVGLTPTGRMNVMSSGAGAVGVYPSSFDLRASGYVTTVKDQGKCNNCWTFSAMSSAESNALVGGGGSYDFSENNLNVRNGFDWGPCNGGNGDMAGAYMTRWGSSYAAGLVYESDDPYTQDAMNGTPPYTSASGLSPRVHVQEFLVLPDRGSGTDNDNYKFSIQNYGAVDVGMYVDAGITSSTNSTYWKQTTSAYYYNGSVATNHAVALIGWDDNYPASNFSMTPPGNGAFIAKNQWGTKWGQSGYFYISYYDSKLSSAHVFRTPGSINNYTRSYLYDPFGHTSGLGYSSNTAWGSNVFTAVANETLQAVALNTTSVNGSYEIYIYSNVTGDPSTGLLEGGAVNTAGSFPYAGYHTVVLSRPVSLTAKQKFAVVIKFTTPSYNSPIPTQSQISGYTSAASASPGQSYVSADGSNWTDTISINANATVNIRAFTGTSQTIGTVSQTIGTISFSQNTLAVGGATTVLASASSGLAVSFSSSTPSICTVSGTTVTAIASGICTIAANQSGNSSYSAATQVTQNITITTSSSTVTDAQVFAYAAANYPSLFSGTISTGQYQGYDYSYYAATGNYLAVNAGTIYILGPASNNQILSVGTVVAFTPIINAWLTTQPPAVYVSEGGLTWMPASKTYYTYAQANTLCAGTINGQSGWRLPTKIELTALYHAYPNVSSALTAQGWSLSNTWSSTPYGTGTHYTVDLSFDYVAWGVDTEASSYVTCVR